MKKILAACLFALASVPAMAQTGAIGDWCNLGKTQAQIQGLSSTNFQQGMVSKCRITVYLTGTTQLATIYADGNNTHLDNPFTAGVNGQWLFFAATNQGYDVVADRGTAPNTYPSPVALCTDCFPARQITMVSNAIQVNGVNLKTPSPANFTDTATAKVTNPSAGIINITALANLGMQVQAPVSGQNVVIYPTSFTSITGDLGTGNLTPGNTSAVITNGTGGGPLTNNTWGITWNNFVLPSDIPAGNITAVYAFMVSSIGGNNSVDYGSCTGTGGTAGLTPAGDHTTGSNWAQRQFTGLTGITGANIATISCNARTERSQVTALLEQYYVQSVGLIVYYTGTPSTYGSTAAQVASPLYLNAALNQLGIDLNASFHGLDLQGIPIASLPASPLSSSMAALINNGASSSDCTVGGGSNYVLCRWNGTNWASFLASGSTTLSGDVTGTGTGTIPTTLVTVNSAPGTCGDATHVCQVVTNGKGLVTSQTAVLITGGGGAGVTGPLQVPNLFSAVNQPTTLSPFTVQANTLFDQNYCQFSDGTACEFAAPFYSSTGMFIDDAMLYCQMNPGKCSASFLANLLAKWDTAYNVSKGYPIAIPQNLTVTAIDFCSGFDVSCQNGTGTATGDGRIMVPQALYLYCQKEGIGSSQCTTAYTSYVAHIKAAWALVPRDGTTHLYTVPTGPGSGSASEFVCGIAFQEYMRNTGAVANCNVYAAIVDADMQALATAAGDSTNATFFANDLALLVTGIRANLINGTTGLLIAATVQNSTNDDVPSSALAVDCDLDSTVFAACGILTSAQKTTIENYFHTNFSTLTNTAGFVLQTPKSGGWTTVGSIPASGGPPYTSTSFSGTQYQGGFWTFHAGWFANALGQVNQPQVETLLTNFLGTADPGCEYFNQGSISCNGATSNLESPAWAVSTNNLFPLAQAVNAGTPVMNKYGAITGTSVASAGTSGTGIAASGASSLSLAATIYLPVAGGGGASSTTEANVQVRAPGAAPLSNLYVQLATAPGTGNSVAFTLRDNATNTALTCTISNTATACNDTTHSVSVLQGDLLTISAVPTGTVSVTPNVLTSLSWPNGPGVNINTSPVGYFIPAWLPGTSTGVTADGGIVGTANQLLVTQFVLPYTITVRQMTWQVTTAVASSVMAAGIYDASGNKLVAADNVSSATTGIKTTAVGPVTLNPGVYYFAQCASSTSVAATTILVNTNLSNILNHNATKRQGGAANAMSSGVLPSTLGGITTGALVYPLMTLLEP